MSTKSSDICVWRMKNPRDEHTKPMLSASELERPRAKPKSAILKAQSWPLRLRRKKFHYGISVSKPRWNGVSGHMVSKHLEFRTAVARWLLFRLGHETLTQSYTDLGCAGIVIWMIWMSWHLWKYHGISMHICPWLPFLRSLFTRMLLGFKSRWATPAECRYCSDAKWSCKMGMGQNPGTPGEPQNSWDWWMFIPLNLCIS